MKKINLYLSTLLLVIFTFLFLVNSTYAEPYAGLKVSPPPNLNYGPSQHSIIDFLASHKFIAGAALVTINAIFASIYSVCKNMFVRDYSAPLSKPQESEHLQTQTQLLWYQYIWLCLPLLLVLVGGAIGGGLAGLSLVINYRLFRKINHPVLRYVWTGFVHIATVLAYFLVVSVFSY